jgi:xylulokinase
MYLLGYDIGSSSIKAALVEAQRGETLHVTHYPATELDMLSHQAGWAEQHPELWWENLCLATRQLLEEASISADAILSIGIAYQMHGLVVVDKHQKVIRPSIIWCDSRAVDIGHRAYKAIGEEKCMQHLLNSPGNFTASKLKWVKENEPELYQDIDKIMWPGDYIAMKLTGQINTTIAGLSEGMLWDFKQHQVAHFLLDHYGIDRKLLPDIVDTFGVHGTLSKKAAQETGLTEGIKVSYRAGDQPNNALSLGVFHPGEIAATGGTSGVVYGVTDQAMYDAQSRINGFAHVNYAVDQPRLGMLLCINGAGIQYAWIKKQLALPDISYNEMEQLIQGLPVGSDGLRIIPFGNGAERMLGNQNPGAYICNLQFNRHSREHMYRAGLEGIAFSFVYGVQILKDLGLDIKVLKVGNDNLFQSKVFATTIANLLHCEIEVIETTGAAGAAKASGISIGVYSHLDELTKSNKRVHTYIPDHSVDAYHQAYRAWLNDLKKILK